MPSERRPNQVTPATIYGAILLAFLLAGIAMAFSQLVALLLLMLLAAIVAVPLSAAADQWQRWRIPRAIAVPLTLLICFAIVGGVVTLLVPTFIDEGRRLIDEIPQIVTSLNHTFSSGSHTPQFGQTLHDWISGYTEHPQRLLGPATTIATAVGGVVAAAIVVLFTAIFSAIYPDSLQRGIIRLAPPRHRPIARRILHRLGAAYLSWLVGLAISMAVLGTLTFVGLTAIGIPFAVVFAVLTAVATVVPYYGALASYIPPFAVALTISVPKALLVLLVSLIAHFVEGNLVGPLIMGRAVRLHPALIAAGVLVIDRLVGFVGLLVAVPMLVTIKILIEELWVLKIESRPEPTPVEMQTPPPEDPATPDETLHEPLRLSIRRRGGPTKP